VKIIYSFSTSNPVHNPSMLLDNAKREEKKKRTFSIFSHALLERRGKGEKKRRKEKSLSSKERKERKKECRQLTHVFSCNHHKNHNKKGEVQIRRLLKDLTRVFELRKKRRKRTNVS